MSLFHLSKKMHNDGNESWASHPLLLRDKLSHTISCFESSGHAWRSPLHKSRILAFKCASLYCLRVCGWNVDNLCWSGWCGLGGFGQWWRTERVWAGWNAGMGVYQNVSLASVLPYHFFKIIPAPIVSLKWTRLQFGMWIRLFSKIFYNSLIPI